MQAKVDKITDFILNKILLNEDINKQLICLRRVSDDCEERFVAVS